MSKKTLKTLDDLQTKKSSLSKRMAKNSSKMQKKRASEKTEKSLHSSTQSKTVVQKKSPKEEKEKTKQTTSIEQSVDNSALRKLVSTLTDKQGSAISGNVHVEISMPPMASSGVVVVDLMINLDTDGCKGTLLRMTGERAFQLLNNIALEGLFEEDHKKREAK